MEKISAINVEINWFNEKSNFFLISKGGRRAHPVKIDQRSHMQGEAGHHGGQDLEVAPDTGSEYNPLVHDK